VERKTPMRGVRRAADAVRPGGRRDDARRRHGRGRRGPPHPTQRLPPRHGSVRSPC
jgi:hypothetical protein